MQDLIQYDMRPDFAELPIAKCEDAESDAESNAAREVWYRCYRLPRHRKEAIAKRDALIVMPTLTT